jgi:fatty acid desaturase
MPQITNDAPSVLFRKVYIISRDQLIFVFKLLVAASLCVGGVYLALHGTWLPSIAGTLLLGAVYAHLVELQHQCLHHSAFMNSKLHRIVGVPLGIPFLTAYSHYRVRHLQHHRFLGTQRDSEFFGFDVRQPPTWGALLKSTFDYWRLFKVSKEIVRSFRGTWTYDMGEISQRRQREVMAEYRLLGVVILAAIAASLFGFGDLVLRVWLLPMLVAVPVHFLIELPEHIMCESDTIDVLRNTRSIKSNWFATWFTNGNNLHVEHHAAMAVPMHRLGERHGEVQSHGKYVHRSYMDFYGLVAREANRNRVRLRSLVPTATADSKTTEPSANSERAA